MCLGIPGLVVEQAGVRRRAGLRRGGIRRRPPQVCIACVPESRPGDYVIVHAGIAISRIDPVEAARVFAFLEESGDRDGWDEEPARGIAHEIPRRIPRPAGRRALLGRHPPHGDAALDDHGGLRRPDAHPRAQRHRSARARGAPAGARAGLPGLRDPLEQIDQRGDRRASA